MSGNLENTRLGRRTFLALAVTSLGVLGWLFTRRELATQKPIAKAAPFVKPKENWTADNFYDFLKALPTEVMLDLKKSLGLLGAEANVAQLNGNEQDARDIQEEALKRSSNIIAYPFRDATKLNYHELVRWVAGKSGVSQGAIDKAPTFALERELLKLLFAELWDELNPQQRKDLLTKLEPNGTIKDIGAVAALTGAGALAALSTTTAFAGFAFYTSLTTTLAAASGAMGVGLPFATYAGATTAVGVLSGPLGWAIVAVATALGTAFAGRADLGKTAELIGKIHNLKVEALTAAGVPEADIFD